MKRFLALIATLALVFAFTIGMPLPGQAASLPDCNVNVAVDLATTRSGGSRAVDVMVLPNCATVVGSSRPLTPGEIAGFGGVSYGFDPTNVARGRTDSSALAARATSSRS